MAAPSSPDAPLKRVRLAPWRGPLHFGTLIFGATAAMGLLLSYVFMVAAMFVWIGLELHALTKTMAISGILHWNLVLDFMSFIGLAVTWIFMLRPLRPRPLTTKVALQVTRGTQPQVFSLIHELCLHLGMQPPVEVWLDTTITIRSSMKGGLNGILSGETVMLLQFPVSTGALVALVLEFVVPASQRADAAGASD